VTAPPGGLPAARATLAGRSFRCLFLARSVSLLGSGVAPVALAFAVLELPGASATDLALADTVGTRAVLLAGAVLTAGAGLAALADRAVRGLPAGAAVPAG
jgi:hypothetical protein